MCEIWQISHRNTCKENIWSTRARFQSKETVTVRHNEYFTAKRNRRQKTLNPRDNTSPTYVYITHSCFINVSGVSPVIEYLHSLMCGCRQELPGRGWHNKLFRFQRYTPKSSPSQTCQKICLWRTPPGEKPPMCFPQIMIYRDSRSTFQLFTLPAQAFVIF